MAFVMDDLYRPLGLDRDARPRKPRLPRPGARAVSGLLGVSLILGGSLAAHLAQPEFRRVDVFAEASAPATDPIETATARPALPQVVSAAPLKPLGRSSAPDAVPADPQAPVIVYPPDAGGGEYGKRLAVRDPSSLRQTAGEAATPDDDLLEPGEEGPIPVRGADGRRAFDVYSAESATDTGTRVAIVVGGLGLSQTGTAKALRELPPAVTLAFSPAGNSLTRWMRDARHAGHELVLQVPMEPVGYPNVSPGEHTLTAADAARADFASLHWSLGRLTNYVGVMNYMGARLTADPAAMRSLAGETTKRGLLYLDDGTSSRSLARDALAEAGGIYAGADVLLDGSRDPAEIRKRLDTLERTARAKGQAIGVASAFDMSVSSIAAWIAEAEKRGIRVVPVSALAVDPEAQ